MDLKEKLVELAEQQITDPALFLVDVILKGVGSTTKVLVLVDGDQGVNIDACAKVSRGMAAELEELDLFQEAYTLEVSSPGLDHPLSSVRQYQKNVGRRVRVALHMGEQYEGELTLATETHCTVNVESKEKKKKEVTPTEFAYEDIKKTMVLVSFK